MPRYQFSPPKRIRQILAGIPIYLFGSLATNAPTTTGIVTSVAIASNVVTLGVQITEGNIPSVGQLITVVNTSSDSGAANGQNFPILSVSITPTTGIGTITYDATGSNQTTTADSGTFYIPVAEIPEALVANKSEAVAIQPNKEAGSAAYVYTWAYTCPNVPSALSIQLEGAVSDNDSEYVIIGTAKTTTTGYNVTNVEVPNIFNFLRFNVTSLTGSGSIIAKILKG